MKRIYVRKENMDKVNWDELKDYKVCIGFDSEIEQLFSRSDYYKKITEEIERNIKAALDGDSSSSNSDFDVLPFL